MGKLYNFIYSIFSYELINGNQNIWRNKYFKNKKCTKLSYMINNGDVHDSFIY